MGPEPGRDCDRCCGVPDWLETELLGLGLALNGAMLWDTPSARMNCSRNSTLVRPLAARPSTHRRTNSGNERRRESHTENWVR